MGISYQGRDIQQQSNVGLRLEKLSVVDYTNYDETTGTGAVETSINWLVADNNLYSSSIEFDKVGGGEYSASYFQPTVINISGSFYGLFYGTASNATYSQYAVSASYAIADTSSLYVSSIFTNPYLFLIKGDGSYDLINLSTLVPASASYATTASYALSGGGGATFPYVGNAVITGSLVVSGSGVSGIDTINGLLLDESGNASVAFFSQRTLENAAGAALDWQNYTQYDSAGYPSIDWASRFLFDSVGNRSHAYDTRTLIYPNGTSTAINYGTQDRISMSGSVVVTGSLTVSGSSTFRNIGPAQFTGSVTSTGGFTGSLFGTASNALTASLLLGSVTSASYAATASYSNQLFASVVNVAAGLRFYGSDGGTVVANLSNLTASLANTASYSTTLGATLSNQSDGTLRLVNSANTSISSVLVTASLANTASYVNPLVQNVIIKGTTSISSSNATQLQVGDNLLFVSGSGLVNIGLSGSAYGSTGTSNGKLTINNTSGNNGLAIRNGETGYQLGIKTTVNDNIGTEFVWYDGATTTFLQHAGVGSKLGASGYAQFRANVYNPDGNATIHTGASNTERLRVTNAGLIGIGTSVPTASLDVSGSGRFTNGLTITGSLIAPTITGSLQGTASWATNALTASLLLGSVTSASYAATASFINPLRQSVSISGSTSATGSFTVRNTANSTDTLSVSSGNISALVNATSNGFYLASYGNGGFFQGGSSGGPYASIGDIDSVVDGTNITVSPGAISMFAGSTIYLSTGTVTVGANANFNNSVSTGDLLVGGNFKVINGVGTTSVISGSLTVTGSAIFRNTLAVGTSSLGPNENTLTLGARDAIQEGGQVGFNAPGGTYTSASFIDLYQNRLRVLRGTNAGSDAEVASWNMHTKQVAFQAYNSATAFTGVAVAGLGVDSGGNIITSQPPATTVFVANANSTTIGNGTQYSVYLGGTPVNPVQITAGIYGGASTDFMPGYPMPAGTASKARATLRSANPATNALEIYIANTNASTRGAILTIAAGSAAGIYTTDDNTTVAFTIGQRLNFMARNPNIAAGSASGQLSTLSFNYTAT